MSLIFALKNEEICNIWRQIGRCKEKLGFSLQPNRQTRRGLQMCPTMAKHTGHCVECGEGVKRVFHK